MKKSILVMSLLISLILVGCSGLEEGDYVDLDEDATYVKSFMGEDIVKDEETGCHYIAVYKEARYYFSPYYDSNGEVMGCGTY